MRLVCRVVALLNNPALGHGQGPAVTDTPIQPAAFEDYRVPVGRMENGVLRIRLELESRGDGVPGWSGQPRAVTPAVRPGDSLVVRLTPPRSGTFMYHMHSEPGHQLAQNPPDFRRASPPPHEMEIVVRVP